MTVETDLCDRLFHGVANKTLLGAYSALTQRMTRATTVPEKLDIRVQRDKVQREILRRMEA